MGRTNLDELDIEILAELQKECRTPLQEIANRVGHPASTVHYRIKRLEKEGIIDGYYAKINPERVGMDYITVIRIFATYKPEYYNTVGKELAKISGVWAVYYSLGDQDFFVLTRSEDRKAFMSTLDAIMETKGVERSKTQVIARVIKEDPRLDINSKVGISKKKRRKKKTSKEEE
ncbi:MAG: Lrp/AsnC family transcriptional regulator [Promethearchaeota archaeon]